MKCFDEKFLYVLRVLAVAPYSESVRETSMRAGTAILPVVLST
jgi:hypothetical protein